VCKVPEGNLNININNILRNNIFKFFGSKRGSQLAALELGDRQNPPFLKKFFSRETLRDREGVYNIKILKNGIKHLNIMK
jgi:hypothetical protein